MCIFSFISEISVVEKINAEPTVFGTVFVYILKNQTTVATFRLINESSRRWGPKQTFQPIAIKVLPVSHAQASYGYEGDMELR